MIFYNFFYFTYFFNQMFFICSSRQKEFQFVNLVMLQIDNKVILSLSLILYVEPAWSWMAVSTFNDNAVGLVIPFENQTYS